MPTAIGARSADCDLAPRRGASMSNLLSNPFAIIAPVLVGVFFVVPIIVAAFLRDVAAGTIRIVSWMNGGTVICRGPGKFKEIPLLTPGTTISCKVINVDLDIT